MFFFIIVLSVLRFTVSGYPFGIFNLFLFWTNLIQFSSVKEASVSVPCSENPKSETHNEQCL